MTQRRASQHPSCGPEWAVEVLLARLRGEGERFEHEDVVAIAVLNGTVFPDFEKYMTPDEKIRLLYERIQNESQRREPVSGTEHKPVDGA